MRTLVIMVGIGIVMAFPMSPARADYSWPVAVLACSKSSSDFMVRQGYVDDDTRPGGEGLEKLLPEPEAMWSTLERSKTGSCVLPNGVKVSTVQEEDGGDVKATMLTVRYGSTKFYYGYINDQGYHGSFSQISAVMYKGGKLIECRRKTWDDVGTCVEQPQRLRGELTQQELDRLAVDQEKARLNQALSPQCRSYGEGEWREYSGILPQRTVEGSCGVDMASSQLSELHTDINNDGRPDTVYIAHQETYCLKSVYRHPLPTPPPQ